jgi:hypothetical protein
MSSYPSVSMVVMFRTRHKYENLKVFGYQLLL